MSTKTKGRKRAREDDDVQEELSDKSSNPRSATRLQGRRPVTRSMKSSDKSELVANPPTKKRKVSRQPSTRKSKTPADGKGESKKPSANKDTHRARDSTDDVEVSDEPIYINRAPVLTLWVAVVAMAHGYDWDAGVTMGKLIAGLFAQARGRSLGIYEAKEKSKKTKEERDEKLGDHEFITILGRKIPIRHTKDGVRALQYNGQVISAPAADAYLRHAFKDRLVDAKQALKALTDSYSDKQDLDHDAYQLYEQFRPEAGWGRKGKLDLQQIRAMHH